MEWRLFANLAETAGEKRIDVAAGPGDTVGDALEQLLEAHPDLRREVVDEDGQLREHIRLLYNGEDPFEAAAGFETALEDGDDLALFPPVSGG